jgi:hypothetical protein
MTATAVHQALEVWQDKIDGKCTYVPNKMDNFPWKINLIKQSS